MNYFEALILGLVQGFCEFLPVSSSGHLVIFQKIFGMDTSATENVVFDILLHFSTLVAVFIVFRKRIWALIKAGIALVKDLFTGKFSYKKSDGDKKMVIMVIVATLPLVLLMPINNHLEKLFSSLLVVGIALLITSGLLFLSDVILTKGSNKLRKQAKDATVKDSLVVGIFQAFALTPGISRSGSTIVAGLIRNFDHQLAVEFSFILSIPAVCGSIILNLKDAFEIMGTTDLGPCLVGMLASLISGILAIKFIKYIVNKNQFGKFAFYCLPVGLLAVIFALIK